MRLLHSAFYIRKGNILLLIRNILPFYAFVNIFYHLITEEQREKCLKECLRVLKKGGLLVTASIPRYYVFQYVATSDVKYLDGHLAKQLIESGVLQHDDEKCFWTDIYYSSKEEMEPL